MPPRLTCLNAVKAFKTNTIFSRAAFSSTASTSADRPSSSSSAIDLLASIGDSPTPRPTRIQLPVRSRQPSPPTTHSPSHTRPPSTRRLPAGNSEANSRVLNLIGRANRSAAHRQRQQGPGSSSTLQDLKTHKLASDLTKQIGRRWKAGDVYAPHDLSPIEQQKWRARGRPDVDVFDTLGINPMEEYRNFSMMSEYVTEMGRIKHGGETGLRKVNQRRVARAVRRAVGLGLLPSVHRHPEILYKEGTRRREQLQRLSRGP